MTPPNTNKIRPLTEDEIARLEQALGSPIERTYLARWMPRAIQTFLVLMALPRPSERRDDLREIVEQGRKWIEAIEQSRSTPLLPPVLKVEELVSSVRGFCDGVDALARKLDEAVGPGHPRTNVPLEAFLDHLIGIAKRAKVLPSAPSRGLLDPIESPPGPPFFVFANEALDIAMEVIKSSPLPEDDINAALAILSKVTDQSLVATLVGLRGRIGNYREGRIGLIEWGSVEDV